MTHFRDDLIIEYRSYVQLVVTRMIAAMGLPGHLYEEMISSGYLGLVEAAERFIPEEGREFRTFAFLRIRGAIIDGIRESSELRGRAYRLVRAAKAMHEFREEQYHLQKPQEIPGEKRLARILDFTATGALAFRLSFADAEQELSRTAANGGNPEEKLAYKQNIINIRHLVETLPAKERLIIEEHYFHDKSFTQVVNENEGMSKSWVSRLHSRALELLKIRFLELDQAEGEVVRTLPEDPSFLPDARAERMS